MRPTDTAANAALVPSPVATVVETALATAVDFRPPLTPLVPSGAKARAEANIAVIELLGRLRNAERAATAGEQELLATWSGWGAVPEVFDSRNEAFAGQRERLQELLGRDDYAQARASTLNAHYTDPAIASAIWDALVQAGFSGGRVLELGFMRNLCVSRDTPRQRRTSAHGSPRCCNSASSTIENTRQTLSLDLRCEIPASSSSCRMTTTE